MKVKDQEVSPPDVCERFNISRAPRYRCVGPGGVRRY